MKFTVLLLTFILTACGNHDVVKQSESLIDAFTAKNKVTNWPRLGSLKSWDLRVDTYTDEVSSSTIQSLYYRTCNKLESLYRNEIVTYRWKDPMGYPGQVTIVQFKFKNDPRKDSYLVTGVFEANDNDSFWFTCTEGNFDSSKMTKIDGWKLENILRCNQ